MVLDEPLLFNIFDALTLGLEALHTDFCMLALLDCLFLLTWFRFLEMTEDTLN